ncbi:MAG: glycoside hydrolase family 88 protein [Verrucomicrobiota bacterium]
MTKPATCNLQLATRFRQSTLFFLIATGLACTACRTHTQPCFSGWPEGMSPAQVGQRVATNFAQRQLGYQADPKREFIIYPEACSWYGSLEVAKLTGNSGLQAALVAKFAPLLGPDARHISLRAHVDDRVIGIVPLEIYLLTGNHDCLELGLSLADKQWAQTTPDGLTSEARYWIDDMFMITAVQVQAYRATGKAEYIDRAARTMAAYLDRLQQTNGLFFHAPDSQFFWSRGNGWVAAGMTELLRSMPADHPQRERVMSGYRKMMAGLLPLQGPNGLWRQLLDHPEAWAETSGTAMFAYAMVTGVKQGWLDTATYGPAARNAWLGLVRHLDINGNVSDVCEGTNKGQSVEYYLARPRHTGDLHGQAPVLWTAAALMRTK